MTLRSGHLLMLVGGLIACSATAGEADMTPHPPSATFDAYPIVEQPLPGYDPIRLEGSSVHFRNCVLGMGDDGLLGQVTHEQTALLARGMTLTGEIAGKPLSFAGAKREVVSQTPTEIALRTTFMHADVACSVTTMVEYDGLVRFVLEFDSPIPVPFSDLAVHIPVDAKQVDYFYDFNSYPMPKTNGVIWNSQKSRIAGVSIGRFMNMFAPYVWLGNYHRGLSWFAESDVGWHDKPGKPIWTITKRKGVAELKVDVIMGQVEQQRFVLDFGVMVAPIRRFPRKPHDWAFAGMYRDHWGTEEPLPKDAYAHLPEAADRGDVLMFSSDFNNFLEERHAQYVTHPEELSRYVRKYHDAGFSKVIYYTCMNLVTSLHPDYEMLAPDIKKETELLREWPAKRVSGTKQYKFLSTCPNSPQNLAMILDLTKCLVEEHDVDGIYLDNFQYTFNCRRPGCSLPKREKLQSVFRLHQYRAFMKKLASIFVLNGKKPLIWVHHTGIMNFPAMSFATMGLSGEIMTNKNKSRYNHIELFDEATSIVEFNSKAWGVPIFWYPDLKYGFYTKHRPDAPLTRLEYSEKYGATYLAMCMLYGSLPVSMNADKNAVIYRQVMAARYAFGMSAEDMVFHPYWERYRPFRIVQAPPVPGGDGSRKQVKASVCTREGKLLATLVNFDPAPADIQIVLTDELLARAYAGFRLRDYVAGNDVELTQTTTKAGRVLPGRRVRLTLPGHGFALLLGEADKQTD